MTACLRASATLTMRAHLGASKLPRDPLRDLNAPMLTAQHLCRRSRSCSVDAFASEANRRDATRLAAASWPRPDGRHSSPSHRNSTNYGVDDMPVAGSLQRRMFSLTSTLLFTSVSKNRRFRCISFCVSRAQSPSCELYRYRCGHECVRFKYSGCNATHMKVWDMVKLITLHACVHRIPFRN